MNDDIFLWYNMVLGEYFVGSKQELEETRSQYSEDSTNVLYTMDADSLAICHKIKNSLNKARVLVG